MAAPSVNVDFEAIEVLFGISSVTDHQKLAIRSVMKGLDVFVSTRTGSGKSLCYQAVPAIAKQLGHPMNVVIVSPLLSIMTEQVHFLRQLSFTATYIGDPDLDEDRLKKGGYDFLFGTPESLVGNSQWRDVFLLEEFQLRLKLLVVDEAHTVLQWGFAQGEEPPFREWFVHIAELRSLCLSATKPMMVLTATTTSKSRKKLIKTLCMSMSTVQIVDSPNRDNIKLSVLKVPASESWEVTFDWLINQLFEQREKCPRTLIFCKNRDDCGKIHSLFLQVLGSSIRNSSGHSMVGMFHRGTWDHIKARVTEDMQLPNGHIRLLVCTNSAGMGVNFTATSNVVNFGPPREMDTYVQQIGRVGRDGEPSQAILIYNGRQLRRLDGDMLGYVRNTEQCRRQLILDTYGSKPESVIETCHKCCDICQKKCTCQSDDCIRSVHPIVLSRGEEITGAAGSMQNQTLKVRDATEQQKRRLRRSLFHLKLQLCQKAQSSVVESEVIHGFTDTVLNNIVEKCNFVGSIDDILTLFSVWTFELASEVHSVFTEVFDDFTEQTFLEESFED